MNYAQLNADGTYWRDLPEGNIEFSPTVYQPARTLSAEQMAEFRVVEITPTDAPSFNAITQTVTRDGAQLVNGAWQYKWAVADLDPASASANLAEARLKAVDAIKTRRDHLSDTGGYLVSGKWFHSDAKSKTQQLSLFIMGANVPAVQWKTMDGSFVTMSQTLAGGIFQAAAAQDMALYARAEALIAQVNASSDPASIDITTGWPETFAG